MMMETQNLFEARTHGYWTYRIPGIAVTKRGVVLVSTEARPGKGADYDYNDILMRRSTDGGYTFAPFVKRVDHAVYGHGPASNFVMIPDRDSGRVVAMFCHDYARVFTMYSDDDGAAWSQPEEITEVFASFRSEYPWRVVATGPGHGTQLRNGRMIVPLWMSDGSGSEFGPQYRGHRPSCVSLVYSDDRGRTWQRGEIVVPQTAERNPSETVCVELSDGRVLFNVRNESERHRRLVSISPDGVGGWSAPVFDDALIEPVCMGSLIRHPGGVLFANPCPTDEVAPWPGSPNYRRERLTVRLSTDDCRRWPVAKVLEPGWAGYSDFAVRADGTILCLYECGIVTGMADDRYVRLARFDLEWLTATDEAGTRNRSQP
jgi:sialidase-1